MWNTYVMQKQSVMALIPVPFSSLTCLQLHGAAPITRWFLNSKIKEGSYKAEPDHVLVSVMNMNLLLSTEHAIKPPRATCTKNSKLSTCTHARQSCKVQSCFSREKLRIPGQYFYLLSLAVSRLGVQYGNQVPLPQLESFCPCVCSALYRLPGGTEIHAWKPTVFAGGKMIHPKRCSLISAEDGQVPNVSLSVFLCPIKHAEHKLGGKATPTCLHQLHRLLKPQRLQTVGSITDD